MRPLRLSSVPLRRTSWLLAALVVGLAGCDRSTTEPDDHGEPETLELRDHATGALLAIFDGTGWDVTALPSLTVGEETAIRTVFRDHDGDALPLGGEYTANAVLAQGAPQGVVNLTGHSDHVDVEAIGAGQVGLHFQLYHGGHADWQAGAISLTVQPAP